mmetsp:Transcript_36266/g.74056  ORF Transcript_36266/g.74056 Transcript_36266/m.74056 type:complete len:80 (-) Transcript_36266:165-404(-)
MSLLVMLGGDCACMGGWAAAPAVGATHSHGPPCVLENITIHTRFNALSGSSIDWVCDNLWILVGSCFGLQLIELPPLLA